jgi:hypothetical protein
MRIFSGLSAFVLVVLLAGCGSSSPVAKIASFEGQASCMVTSSSKFVGAEVNRELENGGAVRTSAKSSLKLEFIQDKTNVSVGENTYFEIKNFSKKELKQMEGVAIYNVSPQDKELTVETPHGMATVLGTVFRLDTAATFTQLIVEKGTVQFAKGQDKVKVTAGQQYSTAQENAEAQAVDPLILKSSFLAAI